MAPLATQSCGDFVEFARKKFARRRLIRFILLDRILHASWENEKKITRRPKYHTKYWIIKTINHNNNLTVISARHQCWPCVTKRTITFDFDLNLHHRRCHTQKESWMERARGSEWDKAIKVCVRWSQPHVTVSYCRCCLVTRNPHCFSVAHRRFRSLDTRHISANGRSFSKSAETVRKINAKNRFAHDSLSYAKCILTYWERTNEAKLLFATAIRFDWRLAAHPNHVSYSEWQRVLRASARTHTHIYGRVCVAIDACCISRVSSARMRLIECTTLKITCKQCPLCCWPLIWAVAYSTHFPLLFHFMHATSRRCEWFYGRTHLTHCRSPDPLPIVFQWNSI